MKRILILILVLGLFSILSCKKDETKATLSSTPAASVLTIPGGQAVVLKKSDSAVLLNYAWTPSAFGQTVVITYNLQMDRAGDNFSDPYSLGQVNNLLQLGVLTSALDQILLPMEFDPKNPTPIDLEFRVQTTINQYVAPVNSPVIAQTITPYYVKIVYPILFVPGDYQGWNPADSSTTIASVKSNGKYEGYIWFHNDTAKFKYCQGNSWTNNWGDNGADGTLDPGGANIKAGPPGYYKLNVDLPNLTHTFLRTAWSVYGDATGSTDADMTYDTIAKVWTATVNLTATTIIFRANHDNTLNYGDNGSKIGTCKLNGDKIAVPAAGNYSVTLNLSQPVYKYKLVKN